MKLPLKLLITSVLLGIIFWHLGGLGEVSRLIIRVSPLYVLLILLLNTADRALMTFKWTRLLRGRGVRLPLVQGMKIYCASMVWGMFLPATMGADAIRAFSTSRAGFDSNEVVASIIIERMIGFLSALFLGLIGLFLLFELNFLDARFDLIWWLGSTTLIIAAIAFAASFSQSAFDFFHGRLFCRFGNTWIMHRLRQFHSTYLAYRNNRRNLAAFSALTFSEQIFPILHTWLITRALGVEVGLFFVAGVVPLTILISRLPVSIGGLGVYDGVFILLTSLAGVSASQAIAITFAGRILQIASWLPWWMSYVMRSGSLRPPRLISDES
jgi:uncharacterized protein (TIRG00374 family)